MPISPSPLAPRGFGSANSVPQAPYTGRGNHLACRNCKSRGAGTSAPAEDLLQERAHGLPGPPVGVGIVGSPLGRIVARLLLREGVHGPAVVDHLPVDVGVVELLPEGLDVLLGHEGIGR